MKWLESWKEERLKKQQREQESIQLYEEIIRQYFIAPENNEAEEIKKKSL